MKVFMSIAEFPILKEAFIDNRFLSIAFIDEEGCRFYGEFRELDEFISTKSSELVVSNTDVASAIGSLKYKPWVEAIRGAVVDTTCEGMRDSKYCVSAKGHIPEILRELNGWIENIQQNALDEITFYTDARSYIAWDQLKKNLSLSTLNEIRFDLFNPVNPGVDWDKINVKGEPLAPPTDMNALGKVTFMRDYYMATH